MIIDLPQQDLNRISERRAEEILPRFLENFEKGYYEEGEDSEIVILSKGKIPATRGAQTEREPSVVAFGDYRIVTIPMEEAASAGRSEQSSFAGGGPTQQMLRIAYPISVVDKAMPAAFPALLWFNEALDYERVGRRDRALDIIFSEVDKLFRKGEFDICNRLLDMLDPRQLSPNLSVAFLTITLPATEFLPSRGRFYSRVEEYFTKLPNKTKLLSGLKGPAPHGPRFY